MRKKLESADQFLKTYNQVRALHKEISALSSKKPDDGINLFKLRFINQILTEANAVLKKEYIPIKGFQIFEEENLPTNSDVVLILSQYLACFSRQENDEDSFL
ncbi:MAG: hypothetical protein QY306_16650 [Anaerolineales bacterium]|nr:MAG: hypothetical protein QY306_16650 [Anaerolineales bacterium]